MGIGAQSSIIIDPIKADICAHIERLNRDFRRMSLNEIGRRADILRNLGQTHGFESVRHVAGGLADAIARDGRGAIIPAYLQSLLEAVFCDSQDARTNELFLATVGVRLAD